MRSWLPLLIVIGTAVGCTSAQLRYSTVRQVGTVTDLQHQLALNNLAAFACNPDAIPFQANLKTGATQVVDSGTAVAQYINGVAASLGMARSVVDQWTTAPVTDEATLRLLRIAYRRSLGFDEDLYTADFANRLAHRLKLQIASPPDMALENAHMFARGPALPHLLDRAGWKGDFRLGFPADDPAVQLWNKDTTDIISSNSDRIIQQGEILRNETLTVTPVITPGFDSLPAGEKTTRYLVATPYAAEIRRQILALNNYLREIHPGWFALGWKQDVPACACYVGHHKECGLDCYVWVLPEGRHDFEEFTLKNLRLSNLVLDPSGGGQSTGGVLYSPPIAR